MSAVRPACLRLVAPALTGLVFTFALSASAEEPPKAGAAPDPAGSSEKKAVEAKPDDKKSESSKADDKKKSKKKKKKGKKGKKDQEDAASETPPAPAPLSETLTGSASAEYEAGKILFQDGDASGALVKFRVAWEQSKDARLLWNMAACEKTLRHYARVKALVAQYVAEGGTLLTEADRSDAKALLEAIQPFVGSVEITADQADADVSVDDQSVGKTPLPAALELDIGKHKIRIEKPGFKPFSIEQELTGGTSAKVSATLVPVVHQGKLRVNARPGETISIDGKVVGKGTWEGMLASGSHAVRVTGAGKKPYENDAVVEDDRTATLGVTLESNLPPPKKDEGGSSPWLWIAGGVAVIAMGVGGFLLLQPEDKPAPAPVQGTIGSVELSWRFR